MQNGKKPTALAIVAVANRQTRTPRSDMSAGIVRRESAGIGRNGGGNRRESGGNPAGIRRRRESAAGIGGANQKLKTVI